MRTNSVVIVWLALVGLKLAFLGVCGYGVYRLGSATVTYLEKH